MKVDKRKAIKQKYRIPEKTFFILSYLGGFIGLMLSMKYFRHKNKKMAFYVHAIIPLLIWIYILYKIN